MSSDARPAIGRMIYAEFMEAGVPIFPLFRFKTTGQCECGDEACEAVGKHPRMSAWQHCPVWDDDQVEGMRETGWFDTGYGVLCRGLLIVDVDARNKGVDSYRKLLDAVPEIAGAGLAVHTGSGGGSQHLYFRAPEGVSLVTSLAAYPGIDFKSSGYVVGPGSGHKSGGIYTADGSVDDIADAPPALIDLLRRPERHRSDFDGHAVDVSHADIFDMLGFIPNLDRPYDEWLSVGMAIHHATQGTGYDLWENWSASSGKHDASKMLRKWDSFGKSANPVTLGTLVYHARQGGWIMPVEFVPEHSFDEEAPRHDGLPFDIANVDLTAPPGFVGKVAEWIDAQSFRPRKHLAVAGALVAIGNLGGLRYVDDISGVTANLFAFCVAGSRTGKDAILKGVMAVLRAGGVNAATHGTIKSEQEIVKNLVRHQASFYVIDEVASFMSKISNAQTKGGAHYLEGIPAMLMAAYSKADDYLGISGDVKDAVKRDLHAELKAIDSEISENGDNPPLLARQEKAKRALSKIDDGLERPFVSLLGVTAPNKFDGMMNIDMATNGFIGRSLVFHERETVPRSRKLFKREKMPEYIANYARAINTGGEYDMMAAGRVENYDEPSPVPTEQAAQQMLSDIIGWMEDQAEARKDTGMESLYLGGYEIVAKVSLILAIPERLRTVEHVRWAFALVRRDIEEKIREVIGNDSVKHEPKKALAARILNLAAKDGGEKEGTIVMRLKRTFQADDVRSELAHLTKAGALACEESRHPTNGTVFRTYAVGQNTQAGYH